MPLALATFLVPLSAPTWALLGNPSCSHLARPHWLITKLIPVPDKVSPSPLHGIVVSGFFVCVPQSTPMLEQSAIYWGFRQQAFISHSSGIWGSRGQCTSMLRVWYEPISWPTDGHLLTVCPYGFSSQCACGESCFPLLRRAPVPSWAPTFAASPKPNCLQRPCLQTLSHCGVRTSTYVFWGGHKYQSVTVHFFQMPPSWVGSRLLPR